MTISEKRACATYRRASYNFLPAGVKEENLLWTGKKVSVPLQGPTWNRVESAKKTEATVEGINPRTNVATLVYDFVPGPEKKPVRFTVSIPVRRISFVKGGKHYFSYVPRGSVSSKSVRAYENIALPQPWGNKG